MSEHIHKAHNVSALLYHLVYPTKYRRAVITEAVDAALKGVCFEIGNRYEITFLEIGADRDHVHFLVQSVPDYSPTRIVTTIKSITAREIFRRVPTVRQQLWGGAFWHHSSGPAATTSTPSGATAARRRSATTSPARGVPSAALAAVGVVLGAKRPAAVFQIPRGLPRQEFHDPETAPSQAGNRANCVELHPEKPFPSGDTQRG